MRTAAVVALIAAGLAACIGAALGRAPGHAPPWPQQQEPRAIDKQHRLPLVPVRAERGLGERALARVRDIVAFGPRHPGSPGAARQLAYIEQALRAAGLAVQRDTWTDPKEQIVFTNLSATIPGKRKDRVLLGCHHDTKRTEGHPDPAHNFPFEGANDGGSAVALLLELAPVLAKTPREATLELVFFDGEESLDWLWNEAARALFGSRRYVRRHRDARLLDPGKEPPIAALLLLDMVGRTDLHLQEELHSTPLLRTILWSAAVACGHEAHVFRRAEAASDDHKPFLDAGIPAVDLIDLNGNPHWHTPDDTLGNLSSRSLQITADLVLTMLPEVERAYVLRKD